MGVNIYLQSRNLGDHPEWDAFRYAGDKEFSGVISRCPHIEENWSSEPDCESYIRPTDFSSLRKAIAEREWPNPGRFEKLADLLERDSEYWVYFSY